MHEPPIHRIVLTGGPCGGKTTALANICERLRSLGFKVYTVPEAATLLFTNGCSVADATTEQLIRFESNLMMLQRDMEDRFIDVARSTGAPSVVICDRGMMDGSAYLPTSVWQALLDENRWTTVDLRDRRYDAVIHLVTAADGAETFYTTLNNVARTETPAQAREVDKKLMNAWLGHKHLRVVDNSTDFATKVRRVVGAVCRVVGVPEPLERERKFLVKNMPSRAAIPVPFEEIEIEQHYLITEDSSTSRVRRRGQRGSYTYTHTSKRRIGVGENIELERPIGSREFIKLMSKTDTSRQPVIKRRICFLWRNQYFELDEFISPQSGLVMLEVELDDEHQQIHLPPFLEIVREVTDERAYSNWAIAAS